MKDAKSYANDTEDIFLSVNVFHCDKSNDMYQKNIFFKFKNQIYISDCNFIYDYDGYLRYDYN